jgi:hypothetical protein
MKQKLFSIVIILLSIVANAQVKTDEVTPKTETTTPTRIKVYTPNTSPKISQDNSYKWVVKTDLLGFVSGEFPIVGEYRIAEKFSVEASAGVTYGFIPLDVFSDNKSNVDLETKGAIGSAFRGTLKFYPSSDYDAIEGWYFGIQLFNKVARREYINNSGSSSVNPIVGEKDSKTKTGVSLIIGKQMFQDSNVLFESYIGIGFAKITRDNFERVYDSSSISEYKPQSVSETSPNFQLGFRIGFGN